MAIKNAFTVDVEDYFQVSAFEGAVSVDDWKDQTPRLEYSMDKVMSLLDERGVSATFFILGWVAEKYPDLVKRIADQGHEIASHGYWHRRATTQTREVFAEDVSSARKLLQDISGTAVVGYRAPSFSFNRENEWVYDVLAEVGHQYSSSVYPVVHDLYGVPDAPRFKYEAPSGILEIPLSTLKLKEKNLPISGGGYFRLYPYMLTSWAIKQFHKADNQPYIFYMHPWEVDPDQPRQAGLPLKSRFRHYLNLSRVENRLKSMLDEFEWDTLASCAGIDHLGR